MDVSLTSFLGLSALSALMIGSFALRLVFAPENAQDKAKLRRMRALQGEKLQDIALANVHKQATAKRASRLPFLDGLTLLAERADLGDYKRQLMLSTVALAVILALVFSAFAHGVVAVVLGGATAVLTTRGILNARYKKKVDAFTKQLPDALDLIMRGLRVGHPVNTTINNVARTMQDPIGAEFRILADQISHGEYLTEAFSDMAHRIGQEDVEYLAVAIRIQHGTGGNLAQILETLSNVVRDRIVMRRRIRAISSEGRISAYVLSALPVAIYGATSLSAPSYYGAVSDDPLYMPIAYTIVALVVGNFLALRKLVSFTY
ncbi:MAG: type II secretion system F family protein [Maritimibacter sp.]